MATVTVELEPGEAITIISQPIVEYETDPDPGEEIPEEEKPHHIRAVGK